MKPDWPVVRAHYEATGEPLRAVAVRFDVPFSTLGKRAVREQWQRGNGNNGNNGNKDGNKDGNKTTLFPENGNKDGNSDGNKGVLFPQNGNSDGNKTALFPENGNRIGNKNGNSMLLFPPDGNKTFHIPAEINAWDRLSAARFYFEHLHWAVHHLYAPDRGDEKERGKKPCSKGWRDHKAADITPGDLEEVFSPSSAHNLGVVVRPPFIAVDLDSKPDSGASVMAWLATHPELAAVPRERTGGGVHLHFLCRDLPPHLLKARKAPTVQISEKVTAELYLNGLNLVVAPSVHKSGHRYSWEVTGIIPEVSWQQLCEWFGFEPPAAAPESPAGRPAREKQWWTSFKGDLSTLDLLGLFRDTGMLGECLDADQSKWAVRCPWEHEHTGTGQHGAAAGSDTVIFTEGRWPAFKCLHAHCAERSLRQVCEWFEQRTPGCIDEHCRHLRQNFAEEALGRDDPVSARGEPSEGANARLVREHGQPFVIHCDAPGSEPKIVDFNPHYWAARFAFENLVLYEPLSNQFYSYIEERGLWRWRTEAAVRNLLARYLLDYSRRLNQPVLEIERSQGRLADMVTTIRALVEKLDPFHKGGAVIHLANGMLHLDTDPPELRSFSPHYHSLRQCPIPFDPDALCPRFLGELVLPAMPLEDARLLQIVGGMMLTGRNSWQKMLILSGQGGAGKGAISRVIQGLVGSENVKQLRTQLLEDRFELDNLDQATLLVGSDVGGDFLMCAGAKVIKALTGGDPLTQEFKGGRKRDVYGHHNILITSNDRLRVRLDGDHSAWKRRLLIIPFERSVPTIVEDFHQVLLREEGSGILNWFVLGAIRLRELARRREPFPVTPVQLERVEKLLSESDSLRLFVHRGVVRAEGSSLSVEEIFTAYEDYCNRQGWTAVSRKRFESQIGPLMMELHRAARRNDIERGDRQKRGFMGVHLQEIPTEEVGS